MSRDRKALIFLTALLAATLSYASFASAKTDNITDLHRPTGRIPLRRHRAHRWPTLTR